MIGEAIRLAGGRLRANALRSLLTVVGLVIGVGSVVTLVAVGNGSAAEVNDQFSRLGSNTMTVMGGRGFGGGVQGAAGSSESLTLADADARSPRRWRRSAASSMSTTTPSCLLELCRAGNQG
jgi:ABC-type lipoprotein release transport system permease subunit